MIPVMLRGESGEWHSARYILHLSDCGSLGFGSQPSSVQILEAGNYLFVVNNWPVKSHHPFICLKDKIEELKIGIGGEKRSSSEFSSEFGSASANQVHLISEFRRHSRESSKCKRDRRGTMQN